MDWKYIILPLALLQIFQHTRPHITITCREVLSLPEINDVMTNKNLIHLIFVPAMFLVLFSCSGRSGRTTQNTPPDMHTAEITFDWQGSYSGVLPCADCPGIDTELKLDSDRTYRLISIYLQEGSRPDTVTGNFSLEGNLLTLDNLVPGEKPTKYKVEENCLKQLDQDGQEITGDLAAHYILKKNGNPVMEDKR